MTTTPRPWRMIAVAVTCTIAALVLWVIAWQGAHPGPAEPLPVPSSQLPTPAEPTS